MADWTRRQFGLWSSAALLVPYRALAAEPQAQQQATAIPEAPPETSQDVAPATKGIKALTLAAKLESNDTRRLTFALAVTNPGKKGQTFQYELTRAVLVDAAGVETELLNTFDGGAVAYLEQRHPFARRLITPSFVDVAPGKSVDLEAVLVDVPEERPKAQELRVDVGLYNDHGRLVHTVSVVLPWPASPNA